MKKLSVIILLISLLVSSVFSFPASAADSQSEFCINMRVDGTNTARTANSLLVFDSEFGASTQTSGSGAEFTVDEKGCIVAVAKNDSAIPEKGFVLSAGAVRANTLPDVSVGDYIIYDENYQTVTLISEGYSPFGESVIAYDAINATRAENKLIIYRDKAQTGTNTWGYEAVVDANGIIISVGGNNSIIPEGGFVISGVGNKKQPIMDACSLGYSAILDETAKTVTVTYKEENAANSYKLSLQSYREQYIETERTFADIDYDKANESLNKLDSILAEIQKSLSESNIGEFIKLSYSFAAESAIFETAIIPYVPVEARTLWLRIPTSKSKTTVEKTVKEIYDMGFNSVCIEILFDSTTIMPMPENSLFEQNPVFKGEDMLKLYIDEFHKYDIEVHAWMSCYRVGHDASSNVKLSVGKKKPEWLNLDQNGSEIVNNEYGNAYFLNPALPEVKEFLLENYKYILENYAIDGFQLDYVRYPENSTVNFGYDEYTKSKFLEKYDFKAVPTSSSQAGWNEWCKFRASFVTDLVKSTGELIKEIRPDVLFSCDVAPGYESTLSKMCQDTQTWLKEGLVDVIYPMAYGTTDAVIKWTDNTVELSGNGIQTVIGLRDNGAEIYREQILAARKCGADGTAFFSYSQYVAGDYADFIKNSIFSKPALCPSYNAKEAVVAQLNHTVDTINDRIKKVASEYKCDISSLIGYSEKLNELSENLSSSDIKTLNDDIVALVSEGKALAGKFSDDENQLSPYISSYLLSTLRIIEKTALYSKDGVEFIPPSSDNGDESTSESSTDSDESQTTDIAEPMESSAFEKVFQVLMVIIMSIGILGLPAYFWLNSRKKKIAESFTENETDDSNDEEETE